MVDHNKRLYTLENPKLSKSTINSYLKCPFAFHKRYVEGDDRLDKENKAYEFGSNVHTLLEEFYNPKTTNIDLLAYEAIKHPLFQEYSWIMRKFIDFNHKLKTELGDNFIPYFKELKIQDPDKNISGIIDRVQFDGKDFMIVDYKQRGADYEETENENLRKYRFELALYTYLFEKSTGNKVKWWGVYFAQNGKLQYEPVDRNEINTALKLVDETRENINKEIRGETQVHKCGRCEYCKTYG